MTYLIIIDDGEQEQQYRFTNLEEAIAAFREAEKRDEYYTVTLVRGEEE